MIMRTILLAFAFGLSCVCLTENAAVAQDSMSVDEPAAGALGSTPWYDAESRTLIPMTVKEQKDDSIHRDSRWLPKPKKVQKSSSDTNTATTTATGTGTTGGTGLFGTELTFGNLFGWMLLALLVVGTAGLLVYAFTKAEIDLSDKKDALSGDHTKSPDEQMIERMKHLPAELRRTDVNLRTEAHRLMEAGHYDQAIILLFGHQLLMLDRAGLLRLTRGKTNGRYVRESRTNLREAGDRLRLSATAFERSYFGRHQLSADEFQKLWENNLALEQSIQSRQGAAA
ncbi:MAG: DUF4129 domain-containing protein [Pirellulaceae bacterium]|nr:DUF4129 domain-containing protein [Pirellulaceae bacterium]